MPYGCLAAIVLFVCPVAQAGEIDLKLTTTDGSSQVSVVNGSAGTVAAMDSAGNVTFTSTLKPNGLPGTAGQVLQSQGPLSPPLWVTSTTLLGGNPILNQSVLQTNAVFYVSSMSIDGQAILARSGGNVGIGMASPNDKLQVAGTLNFLLDLKPNGLSGGTGQVLQSNGVGVAPTWVPPTPLPSTLLNSTNTWTAQQTFSQTVFVSSISGDGSGLINVTPASLSTGTLPSDVIASSIGVNAVYPGAVASGIYGRITGVGTQGQVLNMNSNAINNVGTPLVGTDAATKSYVDTAASTVLLNSTSTWTAQQTYTKQITVSTSMVLSGSLLASGGSAGTSGQVLQSQGLGSAPLWITSTTLLGGTAILNQGSASLKVSAKSSSYPMTAADFGILGNATGGAITITLPPASNTGLMVFVLKTDSSGNNVNITAAGSDTIQGSATVNLTTQYQKRLLIADGVTTWYVISQ